MLTVNAIPEMLALILLLLMFAFSITDRVYASRRVSIFNLCLVLSIVACGLRLAVVMYQNIAQPSADVLELLAKLSLLATPFAATFIFTYALAEIYAGTVNQRGFRMARLDVWVFYGIYAGLCLTNCFHHKLFFIDAEGVLQNGSMAWLSEAGFIAQVVTLLANYIVHRKEADHGFRTAMAIVPFLFVALAVFQALTPPMYLNSIALALIMLVLMICCQRQRVNRDRLTSVGTREAVSIRMQRMIAAQQPFTLQQVSLLHFRRINRRFGLGTGDMLLQQIAQFIRHTCPGDSCFRFNGTDFVIFHAHLPNEETDAQLKALRDRFTEEWTVGNVHTLLGVSFSQVSYPQGGETAEELINNLEYCQLQARNLPDSAVVIFDDKVRQRMADREKLNETITSSLAHNRFFLCYQPIYDADGQHPCGAEALLRMRDEDGRVVSPGVFIPAAEENGSIIQVTWMVLGKVCAFIDAHRNENLPPISINFSAQQFAEHNMCDVIRRYLDYYRIDPSQIKVEITERVFIDINDMLLKNIRGLQEMGVGLYLDDFGTGYSNLASVLNYPIEVVKVDKSLLSEDENSKANDLLQALVSGLKHLDVQVLIEGVETSEQSHRMQDIGVDRMQGFFYARPMEENAFLDHINTHRVA